MAIFAAVCKSRDTQAFPDLGEVELPDLVFDCACVIFLPFVHTETAGVIWFAVRFASFAALSSVAFSFTCEGDVLPLSCGHLWNEANARRAITIRANSGIVTVWLNLKAWVVTPIACMLATASNTDAQVRENGTSGLPIEILGPDPLGCSPESFRGVPQRAKAPRARKIGTAPKATY